MRARGVGLGLFGFVLTRSSARERSGLTAWEAEGGALAADCEPAAARDGPLLRPGLPKRMQRRK